MPFLATKHVAIPTKDILTWLIDDTKCDSDRPIYIDAADPSRSYNVRQARKIIRRLCAGFKAAGLQKGDVVCLHAFNDVDYPIVVNGIVAFGGVFAGINPSYTQFEIAHAIKTAKIKAFISEPDIVQNVLQPAKDAGIPETLIFVFNRPNEAVPVGLQSWTTLLHHGEEDWVRFDHVHTSKRTEAARLFSSGTTGLPKAARISHYNFVAQQTCLENPLQPPFPERRLVFSPLFHAGLAARTHFAPLRTGAQFYVMRRYEPEAFLQYVQRYQITYLGIPPALVGPLLSEPAVVERGALRSVKSASAGAAPLSGEMQARLKKYFAEGSVFAQGYGMTETTCLVTTLKWPDDDDGSGSIGVPLPDVDLKIVDEVGLDISGYDVPGELWVRSPCVFMGYVDNPQANSVWDSDGYFPTGDIAYCSSKNKQWYIMDRKKEMIKVRSFQVAPAELEGVLLSHPQIADAGVIGVKVSNDGSEFPRAYVVKKQSLEAASLKEDEVKKYVAERLTSYKRLEGGVFFVKELPRSQTGKILKQILKERAAKELGAKL